MRCHARSQVQMSIYEHYLDNTSRAFRGHASEAPAERRNDAQGRMVLPDGVV